MKFRTALSFVFAALLLTLTSCSSLPSYVEPTGPDSSLATVRVRAATGMHGVSLETLSITSVNGATPGFFHWSSTPLKVKSGIVTLRLRYTGGVGLLGLGGSGEAEETISFTAEAGKAYAIVASRYGDQYVRFAVFNDTDNKWVR